MTAPASITFIAANLDHGGVADHVKALAQELKRQGAEVATLERGNDLVDATRSQSDGTSAEWLGLHFVCYGWAKKGILHSEDINEIQALCAGRRLAIYLHELWIGESTNDSFKHRLIGWCQRRSMLRMIKVLSPDQIFTSNPVYQAILQRQGIESSLLPLFGNLPLPISSEVEAARQWLTERGAGSEEAPAVVFGTIHPEWDPTEALLAWCEHQTKHNRPATLLTLGKHGPAGEARLAELRKRIPRLSIISTGEQSAAQLAGLLATASFAIATTPWALIGKSGSAAAFLEAGLPVLVTRDDWQWRDGETPNPTEHPQIKKWDRDSPFDWSAFLTNRGSPHRTIGKVAKGWLNLLLPIKNKM